MRLRIILYFLIIVFISISSVLVAYRLSAQSEINTYMFRGGYIEAEKLVYSLEAHFRRTMSWKNVSPILVNFLVQRGKSISESEGLDPSRPRMILSQIRLIDRNGIIRWDRNEAVIGQQATSEDMVNAIVLKVRNKPVGFLVTGTVNGFQVSDQQMLMKRMNRTVFLAASVAGILSVFLALFLANRFSNPVQRLTHAVNALEQGEFSEDVIIEGDDEIAELGASFNKMAASLRQAEKSRREMTADIAHELRTPLAVQRAQLEAMQDDILDMDKDNLNAVLKQNDLLTHLVEDLRMLAMVDSGQMQLDPAHTDMTLLIKRVVSNFKPQCDINNLTVELQVDPSCPDGWVDPLRVEQIMNNLMTNAIRVCKDGSKLWLSLFPVQTSLQLTIRDSGPGIPEEELERLFDRFYRTEKSRVRTKGGTGLGLTIARKLAEAQKGKLWASNHPDGGAVFTLEIPIAENHDDNSE